MNAQAKKHTRRKTIVTIICLVVLILAVSATVFFFLNRQRAAQMAPASQKAKEQVVSLNFQGDETIQERYVDLINADKKDDAQKLFDDAVASDPSADGKVGLLQSNVLLALQYGLVDKAEAAALKSLSVKESVDGYESVNRVYTVKGDLVKQKEYNMKARAFVEKSNLANKQSLLQSYDARLKSITSLEGRK